MHTSIRALAFVAASLVGGVALADETAWLTSYSDALAKAKEAKKPILANFAGSDWSDQTKKLKAEVFDTDAFKTWAEKNVVLLDVDFPRTAELAADLKKQNDELKTRFKIKDYPTIVFLNAEAKELGRTGYLAGGPEKWIADAETKTKGESIAESLWISSYDDAVKRAKKEKKMIMADFTGSDWCPWCIKLKDEVFSKDEFKEWAEANVVLLEVDSPHGFKLSEELTKQNEVLAKKYGITGLPTILFLDAKGEKKGQMGYEEGGPEVWVKKAAGIAGKKKLPKKKPEPAKPANGP